MWRPWDSNDTDDCEKQQRTAQPEQSSSNKKRHYLTYEEKDAILNIYKQMKQDGVRNVLMSTSKLCGVPKSTLWRILKNGPTRRKERRDKGSFRKLGDNVDVDRLTRTLREMYNNNMKPNAALMHKQLSGDGTISCTERTFQNFVKIVSSSFKATDEKQVSDSNQPIEM